MQSSEIDHVLSTRGCKISSATVRTITESEVQLCRGDMAEAEFEAVLEEVQVDTKRRSARASSSSAAASSSANPVKRKPNQLSMSSMTEDITLSDAKAFMPKVKRCTLVKDTSLHYRWQVHYPCTSSPYSTSQVFSVGMRKSLVYCLHWAWAKHTEATGELCPHNLEL
eukprot:3632845-Amphidinium_carterae.1